MIISPAPVARPRKIESPARVTRCGASSVGGTGGAGGDGAGGGQQGSLIVRGQAHLLEDVTAVADLEKIRALFTALETKEEMLKLLSLTDTAEGVQIFIGADNTLFNLAGCSMIVGPYNNAEEAIIGAIGRGVAREEEIAMEAQQELEEEDIGEEPNLKFIDLCML